MKKTLARILTLTLVLALALSLSACSAKKTGVTIGVPNDTTNEARALVLLEKLGYIKLKEADDVTLLTVRDITENPYNITFKEIEAAQLPNVLPDVDFAVINSNYAIEAGITPITTEGTDVSYPNIIAVKDGTQDTDTVKALVAAVNSQAVKDYIESTYKGAIVCDLKDVTDGFDPTVDYAALAGSTITVAASPTPHSDILKIAKDVLAEKDVTLKIVEYTDYVQPNNVVESGEVDANYFQHIPYLENFNAENGTHIISVLEVHHEPMGIYGGKQTNLDAIKGK